MSEASAATSDTPKYVPDPEIEKITLRLSGEAMQKVRSLASRKGITINEFMRRAVSTEAFFMERAERGARILIEEQDRTTKEIVFP